MILHLYHEFMAYCANCLCVASANRELHPHSEAKPEERFKMPSDMLSYDLGSMVCQEEHSRSDEVAAKFREIMATPNEIMDERKKVCGMLHILRES
jgi:hypothetical protein